jgi:CheY-like chemotaxis protein
VLEASSTQDALTVLGTVRIDLLFINIDLPGVRTGLEVARLVREGPMPTHTILASSRQDPSADPAVNDLGPVVRKPYPVSQIVELVVRSLHWPDAP